MDTTTIILIIGLVYVVALIVVVAQCIALNRIYKSLAWKFYAAAWLLLGLTQVYNFLILPASIARARQLGVLTDHLPLEFWFRFAIGLAFLGLIVAAQDRKRRDLRALEGDGLLREYQKFNEGD